MTPLTGQQVVETPRIHARRKSTIPGDAADDAYGRVRQHSPSDNALIPDDVSAQALAPDVSARAPPPSAFRTSHGIGLSQQIAPRLEDWEVEDYVLLATVDGDLFEPPRDGELYLWRPNEGGAGLTKMALTTMAGKCRWQLWCLVGRNYGS